MGNELPRQTAERLAREKAYCIAQKHHGSIVIGADQVADLNGYPINKPGTHDIAVQQLKRNQEMRFFSIVDSPWSATHQLATASISAA